MLVCKFCNLELHPRDEMTLRVKNPSTNEESEEQFHINCYNNNIMKCHEIVSDMYIDKLLKKNLS